MAILAAPDTMTGYVNKPTAKVAALIDFEAKHDDEFVRKAMSDMMSGIWSLVSEIAGRYPEVTIKPNVTWHHDLSGGDLRSYNLRTLAEERET